MNDSEGTAKFDRNKRRLIVTLPVVRPKSSAESEKGAGKVSVLANGHSEVCEEEETPNEPVRI